METLEAVKQFKRERQKDRIKAAAARDPDEKRRHKENAAALTFLIKRFQNRKCTGAPTGSIEA